MFAIGLGLRFLLLVLFLSSLEMRVHFNSIACVHFCFEPLTLLRVPRSLGKACCLVRPSDLNMSVTEVLHPGCAVRVGLRCGACQCSPLLIWCLLPFLAMPWERVQAHWEHTKASLYWVIKYLIKRTDNNATWGLSYFEITKRILYSDKFCVLFSFFCLPSYYWNFKFTFSLVWLKLQVHFEGIWKPSCFVWR